MKKYYFFILLLCSKIIYSQCQQFPQFLTDPIYNLVSFDENHIVAAGGTTILNTQNSNDWKLLPYPIDHRYYQLFDAKKISDSSAIIVGYHGKILKTNDKGITWKNQSIELDGNEYLEAVDFVNDSIGYIFGDQIYYEPNYFRRIFYKTTNGGQKWKKVESNINSVYTNDVSSAKIKFLNEDLGFLYYGYDLYKTIDGGKNWVQIKGYSDFNNIGTIGSLDFLDENTLVISLSGKIYKSTDLGNTWQNISVLQYPSNISLSSKIAIKNKKLYGVTQENLLIYNFDTNEITQKPISNINHNYYGYSNLFAIEVRDENNILLSFIADTGNNGRKIIKTNDSGDTWKTILDFKASYGEYRKILNQNQNFILSKMDYSLYIENNKSAGIYLSTDNAVTWKEVDRISNGDEYPVIRDVAVTKIEDDYLAYTYRMQMPNGSATNFLRESNDFGKNWTTKQFQFPGNLFYSSNNFTQINPSILFYTDNYSKGLVSFDKGSTWKIFNTPVISNFSFYGMKYINSNEIYAWGRYQNYPSVYDYALYKTTNQGDSWQQVVMIPDNDGNDMGYVSEFTTFGSNYAFVSTGGKKFYKIDLTTNQYTLFNGTIPGDPIYTNSLKIINDNYWYHPGRDPNYKDGSFFYSKNQGVTWKEQLCFICVGDVYLNPQSNEVVIANNDFKIEKIQNYNIQDQEIQIFGNTEVLVGSTEEYFISQDNLADADWVLDSGGTITYDPLTHFYKIKINWNESGTHHLNVRKVNSCGESQFYTLTIYASVLSVMDLVSSKILITPNPFKDRILIQGLSENNALRINIYDASGRKIFYRNISEIRENSCTVENLGNLNEGIYFLEVVEKGKVTIKKIIKN